MIEEGSFIVRAAMSVRIDFSPIERATPLTREDAIANAKGTVSDDVWKQLEDEGWVFEFSAERA